MRRKTKVIANAEVDAHAKAPEGTTETALLSSAATIGTAQTSASD